MLIVLFPKSVLSVTNTEMENDTICTGLTCLQKDQFRTQYLSMNASWFQLSLFDFLSIRKNTKPPRMVVGLYVKWHIKFNTSITVLKKYFQWAAMLSTSEKNQVKQGLTFHSRRKTKTTITLLLNPEILEFHSTNITICNCLQFLLTTFPVVITQFHKHNTVHCLQTKIPFTFLKD